MLLNLKQLWFKRRIYIYFFKILIPTGGSPLLVGEYENHYYDEIGKNDTHYVTITYNIHQDSYTWSNRAGEEWTLYPTENFNVLKVGEDCPAFKDGYEVTEFCRTGVFGPGMEFFAKSGKFK